MKTLSLKTGNAFLFTFEDKTLKDRLHLVFDRLWQGRDPFVSRSKAYFLLAGIMGMPKSQTHISNFNEAQCKEALWRLIERWPWLERP